MNIDKEIENNIKKENRIKNIIARAKEINDKTKGQSAESIQGSLAIDILILGKELETYKKIEEKIKQKSHYCLEIPPEHCKKYTTAQCGKCIIDWARKEVEKDG